MGAFHTICNFLSTITKRLQDAPDLCVESGVIAEGSITSVMEGRKYNRAVRLHKIVYEAIMKLARNVFLFASMPTTEKRFIIWTKHSRASPLSTMQCRRPHSHRSWMTHLSLACCFCSKSILAPSGITAH